MRCASVWAADQRRVWSTDNSTPARSHAAIMRSASSSVVAIGFSQNTARAPASAEATVRSAWTWSPVTTLTMSGFCSARSVAKSVWTATSVRSGHVSRNSSSASLRRSQTPTRSVRGCSA